MKTIVLLAAAGVAAAQEPLSLKDAAAKALESNPAIQVSLAARDMAGARIAEARSGALPKVNYTESWTRSNNPVFVFSSLLTQRQFTQADFALSALNRPDFLNNFQSAISGEQALYDGGRTARAVKVAELGRAGAEESMRGARMGVIAQVARAYWAALLFAEQLKADAEAVRSAQSDLERAEARRSAGMATDADVLSIKVHLAKVREDQIRHSADQEVARAALNEAMGAPAETARELHSALTVLPVARESLVELERLGLAERPEVRQTRLAQTVASAVETGARSAYRPEVIARGVFEADRQRFLSQGGANWLVSIGLRWNLFNGFADSARIAESVAGQRQAAAERAKAESSVRMQIREAWSNLAAAGQRIETVQTTVEEAQESVRISRNRYGAGLTTVQDLLRAETSLLEVRTRLAAAIYDQRMAAMLLQLAAGTLNAASEVLN